MVKKVAKSAGKQLLQSGLSYVTKEVGKAATMKKKKRKRSTSDAFVPRKIYKRKLPPGEIVRNIKRTKKKTARQPKDIFTA